MSFKEVRFVEKWFGWGAEYKTTYLVDTTGRVSRILYDIPHPSYIGIGAHILPMTVDNMPTHLRILYNEALRQLEPQHPSEVF
jgi:hypothetical protein